MKDVREGRWCQGKISTAPVSLVGCGFGLSKGRRPSQIFRPFFFFFCRPNSLLPQPHLHSEGLAYGSQTPTLSHEQPFPDMKIAMQKEIIIADCNGCELSSGRQRTRATVTRKREMKTMPKIVYFHLQTKKGLGRVLSHTLPERVVRVDNPTPRHTCSSRELGIARTARCAQIRIIAGRCSRVCRRSLVLAHIRICFRGRRRVVMLSADAVRFC